MARNYTPIPDEFLEEMGELSDAEYGRLVRWMQSINITGQAAELCGNERFFAKRCMNTLKRYKDSYDEQVNKRRDAGRKGAEARWQPMTTDGKTMATDGKAMATDGKAMATDGKAMATDGKNGYTETETETKTDSLPTTVGGLNGAHVRFTPPTVAEVAAYCRDRNNGVDAERFVNHYTSNGWMVGKNRMKDWKAAIRTWEKGDDYGRTRKSVDSQEIRNDSKTLEQMERLRRKMKEGNDGT